MNQKTFDGIAWSDCRTRSAVLSDCKTWRYVLTRTWSEGLKVLFIMLNPSTADASHDDPTLRRAIGFAKLWGFAGLTICNLFAFRTAYPRELKRAKDPIGPENDKNLLEQIKLADQIILAWGGHGRYKFRDSEVLRMAAPYFPCTLGKTKNGLPKHILYLPNDSAREPW